MHSSTRGIFLAMAVLGLCGACGARSSTQGSFDSVVDSDAQDPVSKPDLTPCPGLETWVGRYAGTYEGIVNCLEEKHPSRGSLRFEVTVAPDGSGELLVSGSLSEVFFNGEVLTARVLGQIDCQGRNEIVLSSIRVGDVLTSDVQGWLREFRHAAESFRGTWRMERQTPLCLAAGSWEAAREPH